MESNNELFRLRTELTLNQCYLSDVADAQAELAKEWSELQTVRNGLIKRILEIKNAG